jgi:dTDP-4-amino-4,6-dideoxygalactose transaminase
MAILAINGGTPVRTTEFPEWPVHGEEERAGLLEVLDSGKWWYGEKVRAFEAQFAAFHDAKYGVTTMNGSMALEVGLWACGIQPGDEVITTPYTFIATPISALRMNAIPVFADIDLDTFNLDLESVKAKVTERTKVLLPVHFGGVPVDMDAYNAFAQAKDLRVIEDACHSWGTKWKGKGTGALGDCGAFSFQVSKNITAGEGGIMLTDNEEIAELARSMSNYGRGPAGVWYRHYIPGTNLRMTEFQAAVLLGQLTRLEEQTLQREQNAVMLDAALGQIPGLRLQQCDPRVTRRAVHLYMFRFLPDMWDGVTREQFIAAVTAEGVVMSGGYPVPLHKMPVFSREDDTEGRFPATARPYLANDIDYRDVSCPNAERLCREAIWMFQGQMLGSTADMQDIIDVVTKVWEHRHELREVRV